MLSSNNMATGAFIAIKMSNPVIALPLAFISHFVLDASPHFGYKPGGYSYALKKRLTYFALSLDSIGLTFLVWFLLTNFSALVFLGAVVAFSPDLYTMYQYFIIHGILLSTVAGTCRLISSISSGNSTEKSSGRNGLTAWLSK